MRELKLESLHVVSFETTCAPRAAGGTVQAHVAGPTTSLCPSYKPCLPTFYEETCP
ncbi:MAG TPA: hypothetical protein VFT45_13790 [Longimicrobium sp.]|nr:hypothetical protein [Longimicrobium sp.]